MFDKIEDASNIPPYNATLDDGVYVVLDYFFEEDGEKKYESDIFNIKHVHLRERECVIYALWKNKNWASNGIEIFFKRAVSAPSS